MKILMIVIVDIAEYKKTNDNRQRRTQINNAII